MFRGIQDAPAIDIGFIVVGFPAVQPLPNPGCSEPLAELFAVIQRLGCLWCMSRQTLRGSCGDLKFL